MYESLKDTVCVVTGAAGGIGLGIAQSLARNGAKVAMIDILADALATQVQQICDEGGVARAYTLDITDQQAVMGCFGRIAVDLGRVYALVNNAGVVDQRPFEEITPEQIDLMMHVNVNGTLYCSQAVAAGMKDANAGRIVNFSSKSGKTGSAFMAHYSAAKGAVIALTHSLAFELAPHNITVNCVCPGITEATGVWGKVSESYMENLNLDRDEVVKQFAAKIPLKRLTQVEDVVKYVLFLIAEADYCTGQALNITGGRETH